MTMRMQASIFGLITQWLRYHLRLFVIFQQFRLTPFKGGVLDWIPRVRTRVISTTIPPLRKPQGHPRFEGKTWVTRLPLEAAFPTRTHLRR